MVLFLFLIPSSVVLTCAKIFAINSRPSVVKTKTAFVLFLNFLRNSLDLINFLRLISIQQFLARDFLQLIVDVGMRTFNKEAREYDLAIARKSSSLFDFFERSPVVANRKNRSIRK